MIKRIIACLTICLIITGLISPVFSDASALPQPNWNDPGISEIINISDLTGWMLNGGTYDVSTYTNAEDFMNDYFNARTRTRLVSPDDVQEDYYEVLPGFGISNQLVPGNSFARPLDINRVMSSSFRDHTGYGRRFSEQANEALLDSGNLYDMKIPLLNEVEFANFVGYNHNALKLYSEFFSNDDPVPVPNPPSEYVNLLNNINTLNIYHAVNFPPIGGGSYDITAANTVGTVIALKNLDNTKPYLEQRSFIFSNNTFQIAFVPFLSAYINETSDNYEIRISPYTYTIPDQYGYDHYLVNGSSNKPFNKNGMPTVYTFNKTLNYPNGRLLGTANNITDALNLIYNNYAYINIYVNDELWSLASSPITNDTITPEFPDAVGGEELETTTWPISRPRAPYYTSVPGILQAIEDAIADDGKLDIDDLKPYLTDENGDPVPDPIFDPEPVPIPVPDPVNPDVVPGLPSLPAMPPEMPGFSGVSVLAEIINFTNQSLPTSLIVTFWGIVFGIVILGLIKILHK